mmetsp:Transcript_64167/g.206717  ORF Transcript_64167/g.206717 Transcript_64167/m.206717 type:complete len:223 (+) Transcript_64167:3-671(+)
MASDVGAGGASRGPLRLAWAGAAPRREKRPCCDAFCGPDDDELEDDGRNQRARTNCSGPLALESAAEAARRKRAEGNALAEAGRFSAALACWDAALEFEPSAEVHELRAQVFLELGRDFEAVGAAEAAVGLRPGYWPAQLTLGRARRNFGEVELARQAFAAAAALEPSSEEVQTELAEVEVLAQSATARVDAAVAEAQRRGNADEREASQCIAELARRLRAA